MKLLMLALTAGVAFGQSSIRFTKQDAKLLTPYVEGKPVAGLAFYLANVCTATAITVDPSSILFAAAPYVQVQDPNLALNAAMRVKAQTKTAKLLHYSVILIQAASAGYSIYSAVNGGSHSWAPYLTGAAAFALPTLLKAQTTQAAFVLPTNWITYGMQTVALAVGKCGQWVFLANDGPDKFEVPLSALTVTGITTIQVPTPTPAPAPLAPPQLTTPVAPTRTAPMIETPADRLANLASATELTPPERLEFLYLVREKALGVSQ